MSIWVQPQAFVIASTEIDDDFLEQALIALEVPDGSWTPPVHPAECLTEFAGKLCYNSFDKSLNDNLTKTGTRGTTQYIQDGIISQRHGSVLEHSTASVLLVDVSRVVTHELVRHRAGTAFSQTSGRYVRKTAKFYEPEILQRDDVAREKIEAYLEQGEELRQWLAKRWDMDARPFDEKKKLTSVLRRFQGDGAVNNLLLTANHRAWRHIVETRTSVHAEEETRKAMVLVAQALKDQFGALYADMTITYNGEVLFGVSKV